MVLNRENHRVPGGREGGRGEGGRGREGEGEGGEIIFSYRGTIVTLTVRW